MDRYGSECMIKRTLAILGFIAVCAVAVGFGVILVSETWAFTFGKFISIGLIMAEAIGVIYLFSYLVDYIKYYSW